jgi:hypothetical protein
MSHLKQFSFVIPDGDFQNGPHVSYIQIESHPFQHPKELLGFVNQNSVLKVYGIIDENQPKVLTEFVMVGTGATIPSEIIDRLFRVDSVLLEGRFGYHLYLLQDPRGIPEEGSDIGITAKFKVEITLDQSADVSETEELMGYLETFCSAHKGVMRLHAENLVNGSVEIHGYNESFRHDQVFHNFMGHLYKSSVVDNVDWSKNV